MKHLMFATAACMLFAGGALAQTASPKAGMDMKDMDQKGSGSGTGTKGMELTTKGMEQKGSGSGTGMKGMDQKGSASGMDMKMMMPDPSDAVSTAGYKAAMMKMMMGMPKFSGDADVDFMMQMRPHHQAAIDMAKIVLANGKDTETKKLAEEVVAAQEKEIATIDAWLKKKGKM